jgi:diguanylate cyclase (GGDEF)-like protein
MSESSANLPSKRTLLTGPEQSQTFKDLLVFHNVARALTSSLDLDAILRAIMQQMEQVFQSESWSLLILDERRNDLYYAVAVGHPIAGLHDIRVRIGEGLAGWVAEHGETLIVPEVAADPRFSSIPRGSFHVRSAVCIPLRSRLRTLGVIQLLNVSLEALTDYAISFLHVLCDYAAIAIENSQQVERIQELTITDDCTGLYNQRHLYTMLQAEIERALRFHTHFSLIFIDLDHFKLVNDEYGHLVGSRLLAEVGQALKLLVRVVDSIYRYGGDEFIVLLPVTEKSAAIETAHRLRRALHTTEFLREEGLALKVRASFGVATFPEDGTTVHEIIRQADKMMYMVKGSTRDNVAVVGQGIVPS